MDKYFKDILYLILLMDKVYFILLMDKLYKVYGEIICMFKIDIFNNYSHFSYSNLKKQIFYDIIYNILN